MRLELFLLFYAANVFRGWFWVFATGGLYGIMESLLYDPFAYAVSYWFLALFFFFLFRIVRSSFSLTFAIFVVGSTLFFAIHTFLIRTPFSFASDVLFYAMLFVFLRMTLWRKTIV